jgi:catechol 2,3-dioxygenase
MAIDPGARIGAVHLTVADLGRLVSFYEARLGLTVRQRDNRTAWLGAGGAGGADLLVLHESPMARRVPGTTGLYHFAVLVPTRRDLARSLRRLVDTSTTLQGVADHGVSEALYLGDPEGNGIEIYRDRPRADWPVVAGQLRMGTDPLDLDGLLSELEAEGPTSTEAMPGGTTIGHVHLQVADLDAAEQFYAGTLGFELRQRFGRSASFFGAGGYHHHVAANIWAGAGAPPPPPGALGLDHFEIVLNRSGRFTDREIYPSDLLRDPSGNAMRFVDGS